MRHYMDPDEAVEYIRTVFKREAKKVHTSKWQGVGIAHRPEARMMEVTDLTCRMRVHGDLAAQLKPNLPWADDHFLERICGEPLNPGETWKTWPYAHSADKFRDERGQFDHNYMERYWPRYAGKTPDGSIPNVGFTINSGIRHAYGDLRDLIDLLKREPDTRQAYLPIFFPEDTGCRHGGRVPCSLGYHFLYRDNALSVYYYLRSCDIVRHFRDDLYLTAQLLRYVADEVKLPVGNMTTHISSLHCFVNDWNSV